MAQKDILFIRHGRSGFNQGEVDFFNNNKHLQYPEAEQDPSFREQVLFSAKHVDTQLTSEGIKQCQSIKDDLQLNKVKVVLVSPLARALQSARIIFGHRKIPMIVHPELSQSFRYSCDLSDPLDDKQAQFPQFDFSSMKRMGPHWQISHNLGPKNSRVLLDVLQKHSQLSFQEQQKEICRLVGLRHFYESNQELKDRSRRMRRKLEEYGQQYGKIGVVAHLWALRYLASFEFDSNHMPTPVLQLQNAKPYWFSFAKLGLRKL